LISVSFFIFPSLSLYLSLSLYKHIINAFVGF